ncbi:diguanylate cyclase domain-containing protein [Lichenicola sp.]|uniref:sensor domain-containing diguanylate cyclase n=1 Tax=Lichenicola sp. TaxID=2804529 RepID=UPI003AFFE278
MSNPKASDAAADAASMRDAAAVRGLPLDRAFGALPPDDVAAVAAAGRAREALTSALIDSRQRWQDVAGLISDMVFETDVEGRFVFISPGSAFGWTTSRLLGLASQSLLMQPVDHAGVNPFRPQTPLARHHGWVRRSDGVVASVLIWAMPLLDHDGKVVGGRGGVQDVSEQDRRREQLADTLLRRQTMKEILRRMQRSVLPDMVIKIGLDELLDATGGSGVIVVACDGAFPAIDSSDTPPRLLPRILYRAGAAAPAPDPELVSFVWKAAACGPVPWTRSEARFESRLIMSAIGTHFCEPVVLVMWRDATRDWVAGDAELVDAFLAALGGVLEHDQVQRELARQSGTDTLTALLNRESFTAEVNRRLDRLDKEGLSGTLMVVGLDRFREINEVLGPESGDEVLRQAAHILREVVRPTDLVARLGSDVFALWLDGADQFAAAERAELLCQQGIAVTIEDHKQLRVSVGLATRPSRSFETIDNLLEQAHAALGAIKLAGGGRWHFYNEGTGA